ncbi:MAG: single-stranded DNA-binding protein [Candidatus Gastranaerophilales bacterium]|nr:single-stranded DNA-binding protein [Candidatus Gastranaerophilales bacterium]
MNRVYLIGNLTRDPELATTTSGVSVCRFSIAVQRRFSNAEGEREADFFNIVVWRAQGENCHKYLKKGSKCAVCGSLQNRSYDANDGTKRTITEIVADEVEFLTSKSSSETSERVDKKEVAELEPIDDDSLPF